MRRTSSWLTGTSSATSTFSGARLGSSTWRPVPLLLSGKAEVSELACGRVRRTAKVAPWPSSLQTSMEPDMASTSRLEMASPSPVPPKRREMEASAWANRRNSPSICSPAMPMPVSATWKSSWTSPPRRRVCRASLTCP